MLEHFFRRTLSCLVRFCVHECACLIPVLVLLTEAYSLCCYVGGENFKCLKILCGHVISHVCKDSEQLTSSDLVYCHAGLSVLVVWHIPHQITTDKSTFSKKIRTSTPNETLGEYGLSQISVFFCNKVTYRVFLNEPLTLCQLVWFCSRRVCVVHFPVFKSRDVVKHTFDPSCE